MESELELLHHNNTRLDMDMPYNQYLVCVHRLKLNKQNQGHKDQQFYLLGKTQSRDKQYNLIN